MTSNVIGRSDDDKSQNATASSASPKNPKRLQKVALVCFHQPGFMCVFDLYIRVPEWKCRKFKRVPKYSKKRNVFTLE